MLLMHDRRTDGQFIQVIDDIFELMRAGLAPSAPLLGFFAGQQAFGDDRQAQDSQATSHDPSAQPVRHGDTSDWRNLSQLSTCFTVILYCLNLSIKASRRPADSETNKILPAKPLNKLLQCLGRLLQFGIDGYIGQRMAIESNAVGGSATMPSRIIRANAPVLCASSSVDKNNSSGFSSGLSTSYFLC